MTACVASLCEHVAVCTVAHCHGLEETIWKDLAECRIFDILQEAESITQDRTLLSCCGTDSCMRLFTSRSDLHMK
jgi:hypothetical protein